MEEITTIYNHEFSSKRLEQVRDLFIFSCYTALSYIDVCELKQEDIRTGFDGNLWIIRKRHKTNVTSTVQLLDIPKAILEKYKDKLPNGKILPVISNQKMNDYLKEIAAICGIEKTLTYHVSSHSKLFYLLNISELSILKNVTANDLETSYILFLSQLCNIQRTL
jgi:integrase